MMPLIAVNIGNTSVRAGCYASPEATAADAHWALRRDAADWAALAGQLPSAPCSWRVSSVHRAAERHLREWVARWRPQDEYCRLRHVDIPLEVDVAQPERVGMDRLVAALAANRLRPPDGPALVVDSGTALTVDLVSRDGCFRGGAILPGLELAARALAEGTDLLPLVELDGRLPPLVGRSTQAAISSGLFWGAVGAVRQYAQGVRDREGPPQVYVTGGNGELLAEFVERAIFVRDLVLDGIRLAAAARTA